MPDSDDETFQGIDLLDPTKFVPEELAPVQLVGTMTLNANPTNYFAETEQVAFNPSTMVGGIDVTNDPLLQARLFFLSGHPADPPRRTQLERTAH